MGLVLALGRSPHGVGWEREFLLPRAIMFVLSPHRMWRDQVHLAGSVLVRHRA
jgi:hypothetical protein